MIRNRSDEWKPARQRTPHPNLVPSLYGKATSDIRGSEGEEGGDGEDTYVSRLHIMWWERVEEEEMWDGGVGGVERRHGFGGGTYIVKGNVAHISLEGRGLSKRISEKGRCESDPMVDKKGRSQQHPSSVVMQYSFFFFFFRIRTHHHVPSPKRNLSGIHIRACVRKNNRWSGYCLLFLLGPSFVVVLQLSP